MVDFHVKTSVCDDELFGDFVIDVQNPAQSRVAEALVVSAQRRESEAEDVRLHAWISKMTLNQSMGKASMQNKI